jgi:hypothetical protein
VINSLGPVEAALGSVGFQVFWNRALKDMEDYRNSLRTEAETAIRDGQAELACAKLASSAMMTEVISKLETLPKKAISTERSSNERPTAHRYDAI